MDMNIVPKMNGIFENVMKNNQEWCSDLLLEIINELLHMASDIKKKITDKKILEEKLENGTDISQIPQIIYDSFLVNFDNFVVLLMFIFYVLDV